MDATVRESYIRSQLQERQRSLSVALGQFGRTEHLVSLLQQVDAALERLNVGTYGLCEACHEAIEGDRLLADPLLATCLDHLTPDQQRSLEEDLDLAARIQQKLLPPVNVTFGGWEIHYHYEPAGVVSGDYCDLILPTGNEGDLYFLLGDVSGKGVAASMLMSHLHALFRGLISVGTPLAQLIQRANRIFCESTISTHYATLVLAQADPTGKLEICNTGHPAPVLIQNGRVTTLDATVIPIGMFCDLDYAAAEIRLQKGDSLLLYTDGLTEARNESGEEYGPARLTQLVANHKTSSPQNLLKACLDSVRAFRGQTPKLDDLTVMVVKRVE